MPLSGLERISVRPRGGVSRVQLIPAPLWAGSTPDTAADWVFREDRAHYSEEPAGEGTLVPLVRHTLVMELPATEAAGRAVDELEAFRAEGFVAVVTMASGEKIVAGHSSRLGAGYPLRVTGRSLSSGRSPSDFPTVTLTLESIDADPSKGRI